MLLAIDVGNTNIKLGIFDSERLIGPWRIRTDPDRTPDEYGTEIVELMNQHHVDPFNLDGVGLCSVVPVLTETLTDAVRDHLKNDPLVISAEMDVGIGVRYESLSELGADRVANAVAAKEKYGHPVIVVDCGTATKVEAVDENGDYLGGAIAPGIEIATAALFDSASRLRRVEMVAPKSAIGRNTIQSLQSGILFGFAGQVDGLVNRIRGEIGGKARVIATGGLAEIIRPVSETIETIDPNLTLDGIRIVWERNRNV